MAFSVKCHELDRLGAHLSVPTDMIQELLGEDLWPVQKVKPDNYNSFDCL